MCRRNIYSYFFRVREAGSILLTSQIKGALLYAAFLVHLLCLSSQRTALQWWRPELDFPLRHLFKVFCPIMGIWSLLYSICVKYWTNLEQWKRKSERMIFIDEEKGRSNTSFLWNRELKSALFFKRAHPLHWVLSGHTQCTRLRAYPLYWVLSMPTPCTDF